MKKTEDFWAADPVLFARDALGFHADVKQSLVLREACRRGLLNCTRQWGKSTVTAVKALHRALYQSESLALIVTPSERQSREFLRKVKSFARRLGLPGRGDGDNDVSLLLPNGSRLVGVPGKESTVRGFSSVSLLLIDEAARVPDELYDSVTPMLAVGDGDLWLMSTPHGKRGFFWKSWDKGSGWTRVSVPATECPRISRRFLDDERVRMGSAWFRQEYLCEFTESEDQVFRNDLIERAFTDRVKPLVF